MSTFTFIEYSGEDAGAVLNKLISDSVKGMLGDAVEFVEVEAAGETRQTFGFTRNPEPDRDDDEPDDE